LRAVLTRTPYVFLACISFAVASSRPALAAAARRVNLVWERKDAACLDGEALSSTVERTLERPVFHSPAPASATIVGEILATAPHGFVARVVLHALDGTTLATRELRTDGDCQRLDESVAVVVTLMVDGLEEAPSPLQIPIAAPRPPPPAPIEPPVPRAAPPAAPPTTLALGIGAGGTNALLPSLTPSAIFRGELDIPALVPLSLTTRIYGESSAVVAGSGGTFQAWSAEVAACPTLARSVVRVGVCAGAGAGDMTATSQGLAGGQTRSRPIAFASITPNVAVRIAGPLWLRGDVGALVPLFRERWGFLDAGGQFVEVARAGVVAPTAEITLELRPGS
jgi:hypothetical protein